MKILLHVISLITFVQFASLSSTEFTISSYNCGGLTNHYDYLRAVSMQSLMQERHIAEPKTMVLNEKIQMLALKILFSTDSNEKIMAQEEWNKKEYGTLYKNLTSAPMSKGSPNYFWYKKAEKIITSYKIRPVVISDDKVNQMLHDHLLDFSKTEEESQDKLLDNARRIMGIRTFANHLNHDIICLQEADYLDASMFPENYEVVLEKHTLSTTGLAWNKKRFALVKTLGDILGRAYAVQLRDLETGKTVLIASVHLTGCNPYKTEVNPHTRKLDSAAGDTEIQTVIDLFENEDADFKIIGMDSNVTSLHPRLGIIKDGGYHIDYENYLEPTCTNPYQVLNTRIDWIALKSHLETASIVNIPVLSIGLNNVSTNMSDHKPIAAKITY